ncbi:MAG: TVP38/TMEM64 family protein [Clostridia bacterium]|nr:TVP38/TMEM64 family protein [Clostridia bacterium]
MKAETKKSIFKLLLSGLVIVGIVGVLYLIMYFLGITDLTQEELQAFIQSAGVVAPLIYILISFLQVTFVPIPGAVTILAGNYVFGAGGAFLYSYIGMLAGAMFAFALGRWIGRPFINWIAGGKEKVDDWLNKLKGRENVLLFFMFFLPAFPDDILCSVAGILPIGWIGFFIMQAITRTTSVGATLLFMSGEVIPFDEPWGIAVLAIVGVLAVLAFIISYRNAERINKALEDLADKIVGKFRKKKE